MHDGSGCVLAHVKHSNGLQDRPAARPITQVSSTDPHTSLESTSPCQMPSPPVYDRGDRDNYVPRRTPLEYQLPYKCASNSKRAMRLRGSRDESQECMAGVERQDARAEHCQAHDDSPNVVLHKRNDQPLAAYFCITEQHILGGCSE